MKFIKNPRNCFIQENFKENVALTSLTDQQRYEVLSIFEYLLVMGIMMIITT